MAADLFQALRTAHSGLLANQQALDAVARNVSNASTPGYSRRIVNLEQRTLAGFGAGVQFGTLTRNLDQGLLASARLESGRQQASSAVSDFLTRVQDVFGQAESDTSLAHKLTEFQGAAESLALAPQDALSQRQFVQAAQDAAGSLRQASAAFQSLRQEADGRIGACVDEINGLLQSIVDLNNAIVRNGSVGQDVVDLEDTRDLKLDRLAELIDIRVVERGSGGEVVVFSAAGRTLVDGNAVQLSHTPAATIDASMDHASGSLDGIWIGEKVTSKDLTGEIRSGELAGLIQTRDQTLPNLQASLDELAVRLRDTVNAVHNRSSAFPGPATMGGSRSFTDPTSQTITFDGNDDTAVVLFDADGNEVAQTTVRTLLGSPGPMSITGLRSALNGALGGALGASLSDDGRLVLSATQPGLTLALRDQASGARGAAAQDAGIAFDADGDGAADQNASGFAAFFGLNDFFIDRQVTGGRSGVSASIAVRADIAASPDLTASGAVQWDASRAPAGAYSLASGDDSGIQQLTSALSAATTISAAGRLPATTASLAEYAATFIGDASTQADTASAEASSRAEMAAALKSKSDAVRGVNLDEELSSLMLYEQAYTASARVVKAVQDMFTALEQALA